MFVELLRSATAILTDRVGSEADITDPVVREYIAQRAGAELTDAMQRLCDHDRISSDGRCRYCRLLISEAS